MDRAKGFFSRLREAPIILKDDEEDQRRRIAKAEHEVYVASRLAREKREKEELDKKIKYFEKMAKIQDDKWLADKQKKEEQDRMARFKKWQYDFYPRRPVPLVSEPKEYAIRNDQAMEE